MSVHCSEMFRPFEDRQMVIVALSDVCKEDRKSFLTELGKDPSTWDDPIRSPNGAIRVLVTHDNKYPAAPLSWNRSVTDYARDSSYKHLPVVYLRDFCFEDPPLAQSVMDLSALL